MTNALNAWLAEHDDEVIWNHFDDRTVSRGFGYADDGRVLDIRPQANGFVARVRGSGRSEYRTVVELAEFIGQPELTTWCSCPVGIDCKHAAAALMVYLESAELYSPEGLASPRTRQWLHDLASAAATAEGAPEPGQEMLVYVLGRNRLGWLEIEAYKTRLRKDGAYGSPSRYRGDGRSGARFLTPADTRILHLLSGPFKQIDSANGPLVLTELAQLGRAHVGSLAGALACPGDERQGELEWRLDETGAQSLRCRVGDGDNNIEVVASAPPWYLDADSGAIGPVATGLPDSLAARLLQAPPVAAGECEMVAEAFRGLGHALPAPQPPEEHTLEGTSPVPCLTLEATEARGGRGDNGPIGEDAIARLAFDYAGFLLEATAAPDRAIEHRDGVIWRIERDPDAEHDAFGVLQQLSLKPVYRFNEIVFLPSALGDWAGIVVHGVPSLRERGWRVTVADDFPFRLVEPDDWYAEVEPGSGQAWFDLELGVEIDGERHPLVPILVQTLRQHPHALAQARVEEMQDDEPLLLHLGDGRIASLPMARIAPLLRTLSELYDPKHPYAQTALQLPTARAALLEELDTAAELRWEGDAGLRELAGRLAGLERIEPAAAPPGLQGTLRGYQREGVGWLQALGSQGLGGILADDMGLGKTIQVLAHLLHDRAAGRADRPSLVVCPRSLLFNWAAEAGRFAPQLRVLRLHGPERHAFFDNLGEYDLVLTTYALAARDQDRLAEQPFHLCVLDEAQAVKNPQAKASRAVRRLDAHQRICLTGTPLENHLGELWTQFDFLLPGLLGDRTSFNRLFRRPIERDGDPARYRSLQQRIRPFLLRRTKEAIADELPPVTVIERHTELVGAQRDLYETVRAAMEQRVRDAVERQGLARSHVVVLDALLKLRQVCCDPRLIDSGREIRTSAKLDLLLELLHELHEEGRRILLFSQFTSMLALIEQALAGRGIDWLKLTGRTKKRQQRVEQFQAGEVPLFLISLKAGGTGLNLTAADTVIHFDPWWNPAVMQQATDRAHRIGQDKPVFVYHLLTQDTVEEKITTLQRRKAELGEWLLGGEGGSAATLAMDDVEQLLQPIS